MAAPTLVETIKLRMYEMGLTQTKLAEMLGLSTARISEIKKRQIHVVLPFFDPTVSMGIYASVLFALNLENDITLLAADDALGRQLQDAELLRRRKE